MRGRRGRRRAGVRQRDMSHFDLFRRFLRPGCALLCAVSALLAGCTVSWRAGNGDLHTFGTFVYKVTDYDDGTVVDRVSVGADWRFAGPQSGATLGIKTSAEMSPRVVVIRTPSALGEQVYDYARQLEAHGIAPARARHVGFLFLRQPASFRPTVSYSRYVGLDLQLQPDRECAIKFGLGESSRYGGPLLQPGNLAQLHSLAPDGRRSLVLWQLGGPIRPPPAQF